MLQNCLGSEQGQWPFYMGVCWEYGELCLVCMMSQFMVIRYGSAVYGSGLETEHTGLETSRNCSENSLGKTSIHFCTSNLEFLFSNPIKNRLQGSLRSKTGIRW